MIDQRIVNSAQRISVVGTTGSGKTTLAKSISKCCNIPHVELDALHWEPNWVEASDEVFRERVDVALKGDRWVVDGNYSVVRDLVWNRADTIVWLDYPFWLVAGRLLQRTLWRTLTQAELWNGNRESLQKAFLSRDSILLWMLRTYHQRRRKYPILFQQPSYSHLAIVHLPSVRATEQWVSALAAAHERDSLSS